MSRVSLKKLLEVDWSKFPDVVRTCMTPESVAEKLNAELDRLKGAVGEREKASVGFPLISKGNIPSTAEGKADIKQFLKDIMKRPKTIFDIGEKSKHSIDDNIITINTGIPALKAVIFDEVEKNFYVINTCPGAGACIVPCYARKGFYVMNDGKNLKLINRIQMLMNHPEEYERIAYNEAEIFAVEAKQEDKKLEIRWNDAGDFFSDVYFNLAVSVTNKLKEKGYDVESYAYTKAAKYIKLGKEKGMTMTFSLGATEKEKQKVDIGETKTSIIVPRDVFVDFFIKKASRFEKDETGKTKFKDELSKDGLKLSIYNKYKNELPDLTLDSLKYTDELPSSIGQPLEYNAIILPAGDSDRPAQRSDVHYKFLLVH
jgi:Gene product 88